MQQNKKVKFSIAGDVNASFGNSITKAITGLGKLERKEQELKDKQTLISKFSAEEGAVKRLATTLRLKQAKLTDLQAKQNALGGSSEELKLKELALKKEVEKTTEKLQEQNKKVDALKDDFKKADIDIKNLDAEETRLKNSLDKTNKSIDNRNKFSQKFSKGVNIAKRSLIAFTGASIAASVGAYKISQSFADHGSEVERMAKKLGTGTSEYQKLQYAAKVTGTSVDKLDGSLEEMQIRLSDAMIGDGQAVEALDQIGLSAAELYNLKPEQSLGLIADALAKVENKQQKIWLADALFGGEGVDMLKMLEQGSAGLKKYGNEAEQVGYVLKKESLQSARGYKVAFLKMTTSIKGVAYTLGNALMPAFTNMFEKTTNWISKNQATIKSWATTAVSAFKSAISFLHGLGKGIMFVFGDSTMASVIRWTTLLTGTGIGGVAILSKLSLGFSVLGKVAKIGALGVKFLGRAMLTNPIGLAITALTGVIAVVWYFKDEIIGAFKSAWEGIKSGWNVFVGWLSTANQALGDPFGAIVEVFKFSWDTITDIFNTGANFIDGVFNLITGNFDGAKKAFSNVFDGISAIFTRGIDFLKKKFSWIFNYFKSLKEEFLALKSLFADTDLSYGKGNADRGNKIKDSLIDFGAINSNWGRDDTVENLDIFKKSIKKLSKQDTLDLLATKDIDEQIQKILLSRLKQNNNTTKKLQFSGMDEIAQRVNEKRASQVNNANNNVTMQNTITIQGNADKKHVEEAIKTATMPLYGRFGYGVY